MCLFSQPDLVNSRGDTLSDADMEKVTGEEAPGPHSTVRLNDHLTPQQRGEMLHNWLTAGGPPKPVDVGRIFAMAEKAAPLESRAAAGQGINSLFGMGNLIGDLQPATPLVGIEPVNKSPMQPGIPYSAIPVPGGK